MARPCRKMVDGGFFRQCVASVAFRQRLIAAKEAVDSLSLTVPKQEARETPVDPNEPCPGCKYMAKHCRCPREEE